MYKRLIDIIKRNFIAVYIIIFVSLLILFVVIDTWKSDSNLINSKEILGYYSIYATRNDWQNIRFDIISVLALYNIAPNSHGEFRQDYDSIIQDQLINNAHKNGVKVIFSFGPPYGSTRTIDSILGDENVKEKMLDNILDFIKKHNFDGIDIDIEGVKPMNSITGTSNKILMTNFVKDLRDKLNSDNNNYIIHLAISSYYQDEDQVFDLGELQNYVDHIMMMGYDYNIGPIAGSNSPIDNYDNNPSIRDSLDHYSSLMDKNKLLLGVPWYGYERSTETGNLLSSTVENGIKYDLKTMNEASAKYGRIWDDTWKTPWYKYQTNGIWYQGHYDDIQSLGIKYDLVNSQNIAGIGIWELGYGDKMPELWQLIQDKFEKNEYFRKEQ